MLYFWLDAIFTGSVVVLCSMIIMLNFIKSNLRIQVKALYYTQQNIFN